MTASQPMNEVPSPSPAVRHERGINTQSFAGSLKAVQDRLGKPVMNQIKEMARLSFGHGKVTPAEYFDWQLYDDTIPAEEKARFAGLKMMRKIWQTCNFEKDWHGLAWDKVAFYGLMSGFGFPVPETLYVYHGSRKFGRIPGGADAKDFSQFLRTTKSYPLFCKPNSSIQSLGAAVLERYIPNTDMLIVNGGSEIPVETFVADVGRYAEDGYIVQKRLASHSSLTQVSGENLSTVRMLVTLEKGEAKLIHAAWKLPSLENIADNYWRSGNMLADVDPASGRVKRVTRGTGINQEVLDVLPGSGIKTTDIEVPNWEAAKALALAATNAISHWRLIGWDIGLTQSGPVLVEANSIPDVGLHQIAERRGILSPEFLAFMSGCEKAAKARSGKLKAEAKYHLRKDFVQLRAQAKISESSAG